MQLIPNQERLALYCLRLAAVELYNPRIAPPRAARRKAPPALFPGYLFARCTPQWAIIRRTPGVLRVLVDGETPSKVPDAVIAELRRREHNGLVRLPEPLRPGVRVRVSKGPLFGLEGLVLGLRPNQRIEILLGLLGRATVLISGVEVI